MAGDPLDLSGPTLCFRVCVTIEPHRGRGGRDPGLPTRVKEPPWVLSSSAPALANLSPAPSTHSPCVWAPASWPEKRGRKTAGPWGF